MENHSQHAFDSPEAKIQEKIYLNFQIHDLTEENLKLKTKISMLERDI